MAKIEQSFISTPTVYIALSKKQISDLKEILQFTARYLRLENSGMVTTQAVIDGLKKLAKAIADSL